MSAGESYIKRIGDYVTFVASRRTDRRHRLLPITRVAVLSAANIVLATMVLIAFIDPIYLDALRSSDGDPQWLFQVITRLGQTDWILLTTGLVLVGLSIVSADRFQGYANVVWHRVFLHAYFLFTTVAFSGLLANFAKNAIGRARPRFTPESIDPSAWYASPFTHHFQFASFPSGHSTTAGALALALCLLFPRWRWFFIFAGVAIAISRPALGHHYPSDVLAGFAFGAFFTWVYARMFARRRLLFAFTSGGGLKLRGEGEGRKRSLGLAVNRRFLRKRRADH